MKPDDLIPCPLTRSLRIFAFDPSLAAQYHTAGIGEITIGVEWEDLEAGPVGEYIEVVDADPASGVFYRPVDLDNPWILAQDGLAPSESNPQFHQQMVYAVAMSTIRHFEQALGRVALWSTRREKQGSAYKEYFARRLRIYPHALRDRNAFYSPEKKALLFGYFPVSIKDAHNTPGTLVFTCLSHDIIAHETTHALLDGVHPRFNEPVNPDVLAFHEAFADVVALFQHFSYPGVLRSQIARTRGDLAGENLLGQLAQQFGKASGRGSALRDALGGFSKETGKWEPHQPNVRELESTHEPHDRGAILVAAIFGAFLKVYRSRASDLYRIASDGTGILRAGDIHPDLANRLAAEAASCAKYVLQMCIRAIDYCPPVGITFGDYLRALITGDFDLNPEDPFGYRLAFLESFREWGIHPRGRKSMSQEGLLWPTQAEAFDDVGFKDDGGAIKALFQQDRKMGRRLGRRRLSWDLESDRYEVWKAIDEQSFVIWTWLMQEQGKGLGPVFGLVLDSKEIKPTVYRSRSNPDIPAVEVHSVRSSNRRTQRGSTVPDLVVEITQRRRGYFEKETQEEKDAGSPLAYEEDGDFEFRAGCTLLIDPIRMDLRRVIRSGGDINDDEELERMRRYLTEGMHPGNAFAPARQVINSREPFALLHQHAES